MSVLSGLFLLPLLTSCGNTQIKYVQVPQVPIPASLLSDCIPPEIPEILTWGNSLLLNDTLLTVIEQCNADKASIRQIESTRGNTNERKAD
ncbi:Rz1-like lysis system protein LysC [Yersinia enterocolitica]|uniref:Rz1-like lysis system protein LysC n=1 Tax=Yersinia enterocolitica TaxID=630 RepID=UPI003D03FA89